MRAEEPGQAGRREMLERARAIAETVLFPAALETDSSQRVPAGHLDLLASEGFYGLAGPADAGGAGAGHRTQCLVAGDCPPHRGSLRHVCRLRGVAARERRSARGVLLAGC